MLNTKDEQKIIKAFEEGSISSLSEIENQTEAICLAAMKQSGLNLQYVQNQTKTICLEAIKNNGYAIQFSKFQTKEMCLMAVKQDGLTIKYVKRKTPELCLEAVKSNGMALQFINKQTEELCLEAVKECGIAVSFAKFQTKKVCLEAVKQTEFALKYLSKNDRSNDELNLATFYRSNMGYPYTESTNKEINRINEIYQTFNIALGDYRWIRHSIVNNAIELNNSPYHVLEHLYGY